MNTIGNITEEIIEAICTQQMFNDNTQLGQILQELEFHEGGSVQIEDDGEIAISGDNGRENVKLDIILGIEIK